MDFTNAGLQLSTLPPFKCTPTETNLAEYAGQAAMRKKKDDNTLQLRPKGIEHIQDHKLTHQVVLNVSTARPVKKATVLGRIWPIEEKYLVERELRAHRVMVLLVAVMA